MAGTAGVAAAAGRGELLIDAAHNPAGAEALASYLRDEGGGPMPIVLAAMQDKDVEGMVAALLPMARELIVTTGVSARARSTPEALARAIEALAPEPVVTAVSDPRAAVAHGPHRRDGPSPPARSTSSARCAHACSSRGARRDLISSLSLVRTLIRCELRRAACGLRAAAVLLVLGRATPPPRSSRAGTPSSSRSSGSTPTASA